METQKEIPLNTELSSDDLLATFCEVFGQNEEFIRQWFPIFDLEQELTYTIEIDEDLQIDAPEGGLICEAYNITAKNEDDERIMFISMLPSHDPEVVNFAWEIWDDDLQKEIGGKVPVEFRL